MQALFYLQQNYKAGKKRANTTNILLEIAEPYIVKTELTKNRTHQTFRWKAVAMSDDLGLLASMLAPYMRIVDDRCNVIAKHDRQY